MNFKYWFLIDVLVQDARERLNSWASYLAHYGIILCFKENVPTSTVPEYNYYSYVTINVLYQVQDSVLIKKGQEANANQPFIWFE